ncbi:MAG TPA: hypothetical protein VHM64_11605, partial [Candidatus Binatia bacterium]|nr:hypothetical protein [Candidatus Binatia bacterium]
AILSLRPDLRLAQDFDPLVESVAGPIKIDNLTLTWSYGIASRGFNFRMAIIISTGVSLVYDPVTLGGTSSEGV